MATLRRKPEPVTAVELGELRHEHFAGRVGERFTLVLADEAGAETVIELKLSAATEPPETRADHAHFVEWVGPKEVFLEQGVHTLRHDELGELALFLVPVGEVDDGFVYEAVFTRVDD